MDDNVLFGVTVMKNGNGFGIYNGKVIISDHWMSVLDALDIITERVTDEYFVTNPGIGDKVTCDKFNTGKVGEVADRIENGYLLIIYEDGTACIVPPESVLKV